MNSQGSAPNVLDLLGGMSMEGSLSGAAHKILVQADVAQKIQASMGQPPTVVGASSEIVLVVLDVDDSSSIKYGRNVDNMIGGVNLILDALKGASKRGDVMVMIRAFNAGLIVPFTKLSDVPMLDHSNYNPYGGTPLYHESIVALGAALTKWREFDELGIPARTIVLVVTDGHDESHDFSERTPETVKPVLAPMVSGETHIFCAMGIDDGGLTNFRSVFERMGVKAQWVLTPANDPKAIRACFRTVSSAAATASQGGAHFSQTGATGVASANLGGFGA